MTDFINQFGLTETQAGWIGGASLGGFAIAIIALGVVIEKIGISISIKMAFMCHIFGVMLMTFAVTMLTTPHNLALGVLAGVALAGILFSRKVAKVIQVETVDLSDDERLYRVKGQLFFVSKIYFVQGFDLHDHPARISIDMSSAHIWDQSGVAALDQVIRKFRVGGSAVSVVGLNEESLDLFERIGGQESAHA